MQQIATTKSHLSRGSIVLTVGKCYVDKTVVNHGVPPLLRKGSFCHVEEAQASRCLTVYES
jgi:hypothetical protein